MRLRIDPTDYKIIQKLTCAGDWVEWYNPLIDGTDFTAAMRQSLLLEAVSLPHGIPQIAQPEQGSCAEYDLILQGNNQVLLPVHIDTDDTITITNARGQVSENQGVFGVVAYISPQGGGVDTDSSYPLSGSKNMRLIMNIGGVWQDAYNVTDVVVGSGIVQDNLVFMVNDNDISDNLGTISFHVKICKGSGIWTKLLTPTNWAGIVSVNPGTNPAGHPYATLDGSGAHGTNDNGNGSSYECNIIITFPEATTLLHVVPYFHSHKTRDNGGQDQISIHDTTAFGSARDSYNIGSTVGLYSGNPELSYTWTGITSFGMNGFARNATVDDGAEFTFTQIFLIGSGPSPFLP